MSAQDSTLHQLRTALLAAIGLALGVGGASAADGGAVVQRFAPHEVSFTGADSHANPYLDVVADATLIGPDGRTKRQVPLFWDGGTTWRFRFAPDRVGTWNWSVTSDDSSLNGRKGSFQCVESQRRGSIQPMTGAGNHFQYQNGERMWFVADTAWAYLLDSEKEQHDRAAAERYATNRARQGFNAIHMMLLAEVGWGNQKGPPWHAIDEEKINPAYFQEADERIAFANERGLVTGLVLAWADKRRNEPYSWGRFPSVEARTRYARYATARYAAYEVYFVVSGEWESEARARAARGLKDDVRREFIQLGDIVRASDPHHRMIGIHPTMKTVAGSTREFNNGSTWMDFGDYQQNYAKLHQSILASRGSGKPVVNAEYAYWLRDSSGDGVVDKPYSYTLEDIRAATWDIAMAGGYFVAGFGSTYLGGARHPTTFLPDDPKNASWIEQLGHVRRFFTGFEYWKLEPHDELVTSDEPRTADRAPQNAAGAVEGTSSRAAVSTYWCLAEPGRTYVVYVRGIGGSVSLALPMEAGSPWQAEQFNPRDGTSSPLPRTGSVGQSFKYHPPDQQDWLFVVRRTQP